MSFPPSYAYRESCWSLMDRLSEMYPWHSYVSWSGTLPAYLERAMFGLFLSGDGYCSSGLPSAVQYAPRLPIRLLRTDHVTFFLLDMPQGAKELIDNWEFPKY